MTFFLKSLAEAPKTAAYPFFIAHRVASNFIRQPSLEGKFHIGVYNLNEFSAAGVRWLMCEASGQGRLRLGEATLDVSGTFPGEAIRLLILFAAQQAIRRRYYGRTPNGGPSNGEGCQDSRAPPTACSAMSGPLPNVADESRTEP